VFIRYENGWRESPSDREKATEGTAKQLTRLQHEKEALRARDVRAELPLRWRTWARHQMSSLHWLASHKRMSVRVLITEREPTQGLGLDQVTPICVERLCYRLGKRLNSNAFIVA